MRIKDYYAKNKRKVKIAFLVAVLLLVVLFQAYAVAIKVLVFFLGIVARLLAFIITTWEPLLTGIEKWLNR
jgi:hypothetical protein